MVLGVQDLKKVFIWAELTQGSPCNLFITDNKKLLSKRMWFESSFPGIPLGIVMFDEAIEIVDLFMKHHHKYHILSNFSCNKGYWYLLSFRSKIKHFHFGTSTLDAFARRFIYLLMSLDEVGFQYYSGVNNDTMNSTLYHFNYFISLVAGIFDSFAIQTNHQYGLGFESVPQRVSLNPNAGKNFLKAIKGQYPKLRQHIHENVQFIKLIYELREEIIHRDMLDNAAFESRASGEKWQMNFIRVDQKIVQLIHQCKDKPRAYDVITEYGLYQIASEHFLEPFRFAKSATNVLINFADKYLELLGFSNFVEGLNQKEHFAKELDLFEKARLGF